MTGAQAIGVLMLETRFPRPPGDIGNAASWPFPVRFRTVEGASAAHVVQDQARGLLPAFIEAGEALVAEGCTALTTSCGFLSLFQEDLARALPVPIAASSLQQVAPLNHMLPPGRRAGVLTISATSLTAAHLTAAGAPLDTPIGAAEGGHFARAILEDVPEMDSDLARAENLAAALALQAQHPDLGALVLECTNLGPFAGEIRRATGLPVYSILSFIRWVHAGLAPPEWP